MTGKRTCIHGRTERQVCRKCDDMDRAALHPVSDAIPDLAAALRARLLQMANVAAEKRPMTDVARGYERACDELLEWLASEPVPATGLRWIGSGVSVSRQLAGEPVPATGNPDYRHESRESLIHRIELLTADLEAERAIAATGNPEGLDASILAALDRLTDEFGHDYLSRITKANLAEWIAEFGIRDTSWLARQREGERP